MGFSIKNKGRLLSEAGSQVRQACSVECKADSPGDAGSHSLFYPVLFSSLCLSLGIHSLPSFSGYVTHRVGASLGFRGWWLPSWVGLVDFEGERGSQPPPSRAVPV
jgi:hypothetical protein